MDQWTVMQQRRFRKPGVFAPSTPKKLKNPSPASARAAAPRADQGQEITITPGEMSIAMIPQPSEAIAPPEGSDELKTNVTAESLSSDVLDAAVTEDALPEARTTERLSGSNVVRAEGLPSPASPPDSETPTAADVVRTEVLPEELPNPRASDGHPATSDCPRDATGPGATATPKARKRRKRSRPVTAAELGRNRKNSQKSTGPKTERGKKNSRRNAITHGILTQGTLLRGESETRFSVILDQLRLEHLPVTITQELLLEMLAACFWAQRRIYECQVGITSDALVEHVDATCERFGPMSKEDLMIRIHSHSNALPLIPKLDLLSRYDKENLKKLLTLLRELERLKSVTHTEVDPSSNTLTNLTAMLPKSNLLRIMLGISKTPTTRTLLKKANMFGGHKPAEQQRASPERGAGKRASRIPQTQRKSQRKVG